MSGQRHIRIAGPIPTWQEQANCAGTDTDLFYPDRHETDWRAKQLCGHCTVRHECLQYALDTDERWGIWGGLNETERQGIKVHLVAA